MEHPPLHLGVVAIEKGAFWSSSTTVAIFIYLLNDMSTPSGLINGEIWLILNCLIITITIYIFKISLQSFF